MEKAQAEAKVRLVSADREGEVTHVALFDTGAGRSIMSQELAEKVGWTRYEEGKAPVVRTPTKAGNRVDIVGHTKVVVDICEVCEKLPAADFEVASDFRPGELIIGRLQLDDWDIEFTKDGPRPRHCPVEVGLGTV